MNKFIAAAVICLVAGICVDAADLFGSGFRRGFDDDFGDSIFSNDNFRDNDRSFFRSANRVQDRFGVKDADRERADVAAERKHAARVGAKNKFAEEEKVDAASRNQVAFKNDLSKKKNFQIKIVDQAAHDESTKFSSDSANKFSSGHRVGKENQFAAQKQNSDRLKAAADRDSKFAFDKDFASEDLFKSDNERSFFGDNKFEQDF